jgi:hypothetical protein
MTEISVVAQEFAASRQRDLPADEGKVWETLRLDGERTAAGEEMLRGFLDLVVLRHDNFSAGLGLLLARQLAEYSMPAERLGEIARAEMAGDPGIITAAIADLEWPIGCPPPRKSDAGLRQLLQQVSRLSQVCRRETFGKPAANRSQQLSRSSSTVLTLPEPRKARRRP